jgi:benzil reductase ((S)-benzoin forming)
MHSPPRKLAVVTGTTSGVGSATAGLLLDRDWDVVGVSRRPSPRAHSRYRHLQLDLSDLSSLASVLERDAAPLLAEAWSRVALVNNAAKAALLAPLESISPQELSELYAVNVVAPVWCMGFVSRHTSSDTPLRIVNVSSGAAVHAFAGLAGYGSAKAALRMTGMVLAKEWESTVPGAPTRTDAALMSYEPAAVDTPMQEYARSRERGEFPWVDMFIGMRDRGVLVQPEEPAAEIVAFLEASGLPTFSERRLGQ